MASHAGHDHPATPAARAACRRAGGAPVVSSRCTCINGALGQPHAADCPEATVEAPQRPAKAVKRSGGTRDHTGRAIRNTGDLGALAVPHVFGSVIRWAWGQGMEVHTGNTYNDDQRTVVIVSTHGYLTLTWRSARPDGVHAVSYRPGGTPVWTQLPTVNEGIRALDGHWLDGGHDGRS
jgi:hypothetical protein